VTRRGVARTRLSARTALLMLGSLVLVGMGASGAPAASAANGATEPISWLAAGDSYSSGEGLPHYAGPCVQALKGTGSEVWADNAYDDLAGSMPGLEAPVLVACTGAKIDQFVDHSDKAGTSEFDGTKQERVDLVTFTFGGDDVGFRPIIEQCIGLTSQWPTDPGHNCPKDSIVRSIIADKVGARYPGFLDEVANKAMIEGGNIVVLGYPDLIEDPQFWPGLDKFLGMCMGILAHDTQLIRAWAGDLNATIGQAVSTFDSQPPTSRRDVEATFVDVNTGQPASPSHIAVTNQNLFEPSSGPRHNICASESWLNGVSAIDGLAGSFHPKQQGQDAMGHLAAAVISKLDWSQLSPGPPSVPSASPPANSWNGTTINGEDDMQSVTCPTTSSCVAVDSDGDVTYYNGTTWTQPQSVDNTGAFINSVSCAGSGVPRLCAIVDNAGNISTFNGINWGPVQNLDPDGDGLMRVACASTSFCVAVDYNGSALIYDGSRWSSPQVIDSAGRLWAVSCPSAGFCAALDLNGKVVYYNNGTWSSPILADPANGIVGDTIDCTSSTSCMISDSNGDIVVSHQQGLWGFPDKVDQDRIVSVACATPTSCVAVDLNGNVLSFDGSGWTQPQPLLPLPPSVGMETVWCATATFCAAVGGARVYVSS